MTAEMKRWKAFRITMLLYLILIVMGVSSLFIYTAFAKIKQDQKVMYSIGMLDGIDAAMTVSDTGGQKALKLLQEWATSNSDSELYTGERPLSEDLKKVQRCMTSEKAAASEKMDECRASVHNTAINIGNMVALRQHRFINIVLFTFATIALIVIVLIYFVRAYIAYQMKKHAIVDFETGLFNRRYYDSVLERLVANMRRYDENASMITMNLSALAQVMNKKEKQQMLGVIGELLIAHVRTGDVACRAAEEKVVILLPETGIDRAKILLERLQRSIDENELVGRNKFAFEYEVSPL